MTYTSLRCTHTHTTCIPTTTPAYPPLFLVHQLMAAFAGHRLSQVGWSEASSVAQRVELMPSLSHHLKEESVHAREYRLTSLGIVANIQILHSATRAHTWLSLWVYCFRNLTPRSIVWPWTWSFLATFGGNHRHGACNWSLKRAD